MTDLQPSKLGTKEYWDHVYEEELASFHDIGTEGEIWFGEDTENKILEWCLEYHPPSSTPSILEVGTGNGAMLFSLVDVGNYHPTLLHGIDYSPGAINLCMTLASDRGFGTEKIRFILCDFFCQDPSPDPAFDGWDLILDKGTFDAMALGEKDEEGQAPTARYPERLFKLLKPGGRFLITSCNFTEDELKEVFISPQTGLIYHSCIQHRTYTYGGKIGSVLSSVAFEKPR